MPPELDLSPLLRGASGDELRVAGVGVGDPASAVDRAALTGAEENAPGEPRTYADGTVYRTGPDGALVEVPLGERVDATLRTGGVLRKGDIALRVAGGRLEHIVVRGPSLETLGIRREEEIARAFGPAEGQDRRFGWHVHHYPSRRLVIAWDDRAGRLEHVALGEVTWSEPRLGARELLAELLAAFALLAPGWAEPAETGSGRVRHQRIAALAGALGLGSPALLASGQFLDGELAAGRRRVLEELAGRSLGGRVAGQRVRDWSARMVFVHLLHYRHDAERLVQATRGWLECSDPALLGMIAAQDGIAASVTSLMADVDRWLCTLMDPDGRTFERRELIARHGWPDVDLAHLEMDEL